MASPGKAAPFELDGVGVVLFLCGHRYAQNSCGRRMFVVSIGTVGINISFECHVEAADALNGGNPIVKF